MKKRIIAIAKYLVFLLTGAGLVWWQFSRMTANDKTDFVESIRNVHYVYLFPIIIIGLLSHYFRGLRWKMLIDPIKKVSGASSFYSVMVGYLGNTFVPRAGEVLRCSMMAKYQRVSFSKLIGTVIVERVFDLFCYVLFILLTIFSQLETVGRFVSAKLEKIFANDTATPRWLKISVFLAAVILLYVIINWLLKKYSGHKFIGKFLNLWNRFKEGLTTIFHMEKKGWFLIYTFLIWLMYLLQIYLGFKAVDATEHLGIGAAMSVLTLSTLAMIISPGGLGAFPVAVQQVLLVYHVNNISFGWLVWGANTIFIIVAGIICFFLLTIQNKQVHKHPSASTQ